MPRLENWSLGVTSVNPYQPPEAQTSVLRGEVYGHPSHPDGSFITTSTVRVFDHTSYREAVTYSGSKYVLGRPDANWVKYLKDANFASADALERRLANGLEVMLKHVEESKNDG